MKSITEIYKSAFADIKQAQLESPDVVIEPLEPAVQEAVRLLRQMDNNYFQGVSKIVISPSPQFGHVQSGPGHDPTVININSQKIMSEVGHNTMSPELIAAIATTIAHEKGHVGSFDPQQGFVGGEAVAEQEEQRVAQYIQQHYDTLLGHLQQAQS